MAKIYVGCALTGAPQEFVDKVELLKALLREEGYEVPDFLGLVKGTAQDVYEVDIWQRVAECDLLVAICDVPSIGLGWEMATAVEKRRKPVLAVAHKDTRITRLIIGAEGERNPLYRFRRYDKIEDVVGMTCDTLTVLSGDMA